MTEGRITRRSVLTAGAGAALAYLLEPPHSALAAIAGPPRPAVSEQRVGTLGTGAVTVRLSRRADLLGLQWRTPAHARVQLRFRDGHGRWSGWVSAAANGHGPDLPARRKTVVGDPVWTGGTDAVQLRADTTLSDVRLHLVDVSGGVGAGRTAAAAGPLAIADALPLAAPTLQAGAGQPPIIARRAWARGRCRPRVTPGYGTVQMAFVHHTDNPNGYRPREVPAMLRAIFAFHRFVHGWNDIGYNFVIDAFGRIFEARAGGIAEPVIGAQAGGYNLVSTGVAVLGTFDSRPISPAARAALQKLLAWKLSLHGVPAEGAVTVRVNPQGSIYSRFPANALVALPRIAGHRDGDTTDCPGNALYGQLPAIRSSVLGLSGRPLRATLELTTRPPAQIGQPNPAAALSGSLTFLDGAPIAAATISVQSRSVARRGEVLREQTIAQAITDSTGRWSMPVTLMPRSRGGLSLRALYLGAGGATPIAAAISDPLFVAAALTPAPAAAPTAPAPGAPAT